MSIEFISYTGKYPCLCSGVLTLKIDNKIVKFGHTSDTYNYRTGSYTDDAYDTFWISGGTCGFRGNYVGEYTTKKPWELRDDALPDIYLPIAKELIDVFNNNVPYGCCGGCL